MRVAIRVDASQDIGTGHVRRCLALAVALRELGGDVRFVARDLGLSVPDLVHEHGFATITLASPQREAGVVSSYSHGAWAGVAELADAADTVAALDTWRPAWIVVDHYAFAADWHAHLRTNFKCRIAAIDDLADRPLAIDLLVDHNYSPDHRAKYSGTLDRRATLLGGPRFALLGPAYADAQRCVPSADVRSIGVFMGGVDRDDASSLTLAAINAAGFAGEVEVVTTSANPNLALLKQAIANRALTSLTIDLPDLAAFFARHDLQVGAGGGASWERCCIGAPTLLLLLAENQRAVVPALVDAGIVATPEPVGTLDLANLSGTIRDLVGDPRRRATLSARARTLVDGHGARRVGLRMLANTVTVRPAGPEDAAMMHRWRNDPATRSVSRNTQEIAWADHLAWTLAMLADPERSLLVGMVGKVAIGVIRFDRLSNGRAEVSLYLDPTLHGFGLGRAMLLAGEAVAVPGLDILAEVLDGNAGSARLFESAGYRYIEANHWIKSVDGRPTGELKP